jgi:hypothetical protein
MAPNLLGLWERQLQLDAGRAERQLGLQWTPYSVGLQQAAAWWLGRRGGVLAGPAASLRGHDSPG